MPIVVGYALLPSSAGKKLHLENAGLLWLLLIVISVVGAFVFMNNLSSARSNLKDQVICRAAPTHLDHGLLYIGTFGSFVGFSAAFPLLLKTQFPEVTTNLAFLGALVGSVARPLGGKLADRIGGAKVTFWNFVVMTCATVGLLYSLQTKAFPLLFLFTFLLLFITTGVGNGSTFRMIPVIFRTFHSKRAQGQGEASRGHDRSPRNSCGDRCGRCGRRTRRLLHSARVRRFDQGDGRRDAGRLLVHRVLRHLRGDDLRCWPVLLPDSAHAELGQRASLRSPSPTARRDMSKNYFESDGSRPRLVVVGNGMVGHRFLEAAAERGLLEKFETVVLSEEKRLAYDRVNLSKWFEGKTDAVFSLVSEGQYEAWGLEVVRGDAAVSLDRQARVVRLASGRELAYDELVLANGSYPFVPPIPGKDQPGCLVYRTIDDLEAIRDAAQSATQAAVIGGGLLV